MKYKVWLTEWLDNYVKPTSKARTFDRYSEIADKHLKTSLGEYELENLKPIILQRYITELLQSGNRRTGKGLAANSVNNIITVIQNSLKTAFTVGELKEYSSDKIIRPKTKEKEILCFSVTEQKKIEQAVAESKKSKMFGVMLSLYSGLRIGELLALEWRDIDLLKGTVSVNKTCHDGKDKSGRYRRFTDTPKTISSKRIIPLPKQIVPLIREQKRKSNSDYIVSGGEEAVSVRSYQRSFELLLKWLKIEHKGFHSLRHTFATRALECGMDVKTLSEILGHKNPNLTLSRYVHSMLEHKRDMMNKLGKML